MPTIYTFDFDGTLTTKDTLLVFIQFVKGRCAFWLGFLCYAPLLVLMKLRLYPNYKAKQLIFSHFFRGMPLSTFETLCEQFAEQHQDLLRPLGIATLQKAVTQGHQVLIISASIDHWVKPFFKAWPQVQVLGTQIEITDGHLTGRFTTPNCYGEEKVNRLKALFPQRSTYHLIAFGDSRGDKALLAYANQAHYKPFR